MAETFTDPEAHAGTCYKAAGWEPVGKTVGSERHRCDFFAFHDHPKRLWLKPLAPNAKEKLCAPELSARQLPALTVGAAARCALNADQRSSLKDALRQLPDPRRAQRKRYPLAPTLTVVALDLNALADVLTRWLQAQAGRLPVSLALDGKTIRDHLGCIVSLVEHEDGAPVALIAAPNKGHELPAAQKLLRSEAVNLLDCVVTADTLHCQKETAQIITQEKGGDYVLGVKDNQPTVRQNAQKKLAGATPLLPGPSPTAVAAKPAP